MVDAPKRIWATFEPHESGKGHPHTYATAMRTKGQEYVRSDLVAELEAENARTKQWYLDAIEQRDKYARLWDEALSRTGAVKAAGVIDTLIESLSEGLMTDAGLSEEDRDAMRHQIVALETAKAEISALEPAAPESEKPIDQELRDAAMEAGRHE